jgi:hypothetical protein
MIVKAPKRNDKGSLFLLDRTTRRAAAFAALQPRVVSSITDLRNSLVHASKDSIWVSYASDLTEALIRRAVAAPAPLGVGVFIHALNVKSLPALSSLFRRIAFTVDGGFIRAEELAEVLAAENRANLFIGGFVNEATETITFWRGSLESLTIPFLAFAKSGDGATPNFDALSVIDCGQTVKLGNYEAAADAILYEYDPAYRRTIARTRRQEDRSFGASLRRLRKQRGLRREDFEPAVSAKTVARIEQGKVTRIQEKTMRSLAGRLAVDPQEIATF